MGSTVGMAVQGNPGAHCGSFARTAGCEGSAGEWEPLVGEGGATVTEPLGCEAGSRRGGGTVEVAIGAVITLVADSAAGEVCSGVALLRKEAGCDPALRLVAHLDRIATRELLLEQVDRTYMLARRGCGDQEYLEAAIAAFEFLSSEYPDDPQTRSLGHLVVDVAVWMGWDARAASPCVKAGVLAAARYTEEHPEPDFYVTVDDPWLSVAAPVRFLAVHPWWLPLWARGLAAWIAWDLFLDTHVEGRRRVHPCDHRQRARDLIRAIG